MKLNTRALALSIGILWGLHFLIMGIAIVICPGIGESWMAMWASLYPCYQADGTLLDTAIGVAFGFIDGLIGGALIAWLYNRLLR
jgi:hypothetical protein